jgi:uncharacterized protein (DUF983 family)
MVDDNPKTKGQPGIAEAALFGLCPKCADRALFDGVAIIAPRCTGCGLDYSKSTASEGAGGLLTALIAVLIMALAIGLDILLSPPFWVHALLWAPLTLAAVFFGLRAARVSVIYSEYDENTAEVVPKK